MKKVKILSFYRGLDAMSEKTISRYYPFKSPNIVTVCVLQGLDHFEFQGGPCSDPGGDQCLRQGTRRQGIL